jgi:hypothetical protein
VTGSPASAANLRKDDTLTATATCTPGQSVLGGGGTVTVDVPNDLGEVQLQQSFPSSTTVWTVVAASHSDLGSAVTTVTAYVICA